jgi:hypothetical protein
VLWRRFDRALTVTRIRTVGGRAVNIQVKQNLDTKVGFKSSENCASGVLVR